MHADPDLERLRIEHLRQLDDHSRQEPPDSDGSLTVVATTATDGSYPTNPDRCFKMQILAVFGPQTEGATPTTASLGGYLYAFNLGTGIPPLGVGTHRVTFVPYRWTFRYD